MYKENVPEEVTLKLTAKEQEILSEEVVWGECCKHRKEGREQEGGRKAEVLMILCLLKRTFHFISVERKYFSGRKLSGAISHVHKPGTSVMKGKAFVG